MKIDLSKCPQCGGLADNGHDRCYPPSPYWCSKCMAKEAAPVVIRPGQVWRSIHDDHRLTVFAIVKRSIEYTDDWNGGKLTMWRLRQEYTLESDVHPKGGSK